MCCDTCMTSPTLGCFRHILVWGCDILFTPATASFPALFSDKQQALGRSLLVDPSSATFTAPGHSRFAHRQPVFRLPPSSFPVSLLAARCLSKFKVIRSRIAALFLPCRGCNSPLLHSQVIVVFWHCFQAFRRTRPPPATLTMVAGGGGRNEVC